MRRILPPLLIVVLAGIVGARMLMKPARHGARERIRSMQSDPTQLEDTAEALDRYLERYDEPEDRWFAAEVFLRIGSWSRALELAFQDGAPGAARRFGDLGLRTAGWRDDDRTEPTRFEPNALLALAEAGEPWAVERLREHAMSLPLEASAHYLFHATRFSDPKMLRILAEGFRDSLEADPDRKEELLIAAAFSTLGPEPYEGREADIDRLIETVRTRRRLQGDVWTAAAVALGRSEAPRALDALHALEASLAEATEPRDRRDHLLVRIALLAAGEWSGFEALKPLVDRDPVDYFAVDWFTEAVLTRFVRGDPEADPAIAWTFDTLGARAPRARGRIGIRILLPVAPPETDDLASRAPAQHWVEMFWASRDSPLAPGVAASYGLRTGAPDALPRMLELMAIIAETLEEGPHRHDRVMPGWILCLRGLRLYG